MPAINLLIVDCKIHTSGEIKSAFESKGCQVSTVRNGAHALKMLSFEYFDLMLLDLDLPDSDALELLKIARMECPELLIIMKTSQATLESALCAIKAGVADYLVEPLEAHEIISSIENILQKKRLELNRNQKIQSILKAVRTLDKENLFQDSVDLLEAGDNTNANPAFSLDLSKRQLVCANSQTGVEFHVELTSHEFALLSYLMQFPEKVLTSRELALKTLGYTNISENEARGIIRPHISRLRKKIEGNPDIPDLIHTIRGRGYVFSARK